MDREKSGPLVSICCCTFNHEKFIRATLNGFVMQQTNFDFEILVHDDASTDSTAKIVREYEEKYPHLFRCVYQTENQFLKQNVLLNILFKMSKGKYIALCEGDDYWTDTSKLQKQADFLELSEDYVCHCHNSKIIKNEEFVRDYNDIKESKEIPRKDLITSLAIPTASVVFRNVLNGSIPDYLAKFSLDITIFFALSEHGKFFLSKEIMSVYRIHDDGFWSGQNDLQKINKSMEIQSYILKELPLNEEEKKAVSEVIVGLKLNRLKLFANQYRFGASFWKDFAAIIRAKSNGQSISTKYFLYCVFPSNLISYVQQIRGKKAVNS